LGKVGKSKKNQKNGKKREGKSCVLGSIEKKRLAPLSNNGSTSTTVATLHGEKGKMGGPLKPEARRKTGAFFRYINVW